MAEFSLRQRIRAISLDTGETDEHKIADKLLSDLTPAEQRAALAQTLPDYVRNTLSQRWPIPPDQSPIPGQGRHRGRAVKEAWYTELQRVWTTEDGEKRFADFTVADCQFVAADRRAQAANLTRAAEQQERAGHMLAKHRKTHVGELPKSALEYVFGGTS